MHSEYAQSHHFVLEKEGDDGEKRKIILFCHVKSSFAQCISMYKLSSSLQMRKFFFWFFFAASLRKRWPKKKSITVKFAYCASKEQYIYMNISIQMWLNSSNAMPTENSMFPSIAVRPKQKSKLKMNVFVSKQTSAQNRIVDKNKADMTRPIFRDGILATEPHSILIWI